MSSTFLKLVLGVCLTLCTVHTCISFPSQKADKKTIEISYNRSIETFIILRAISDSDYVFNELMRKNGKDAIKVRPLLYEARKYFSSFRKHPAVTATQQLQLKIEDYGGIVFQGLLYAEELPSITIKYEPTDDYWKGKQSELSTYLKILQSFYIEAKVEEFFRINEKFYTGAIAEAKSYLNSGVIETMETYFGKKNDAYKMIIIPMNPFSMGFGANTGTVLYEIISPANDTEWQAKQKKYTTFGYGGEDAKEYYRDMVTHEFCHSFITNIIEQENWETEINRFDSLYTPQLDSVMNRQGYGDWWGFVNELLVRTGEIRVTKTMGLKADAAEMSKENCVTYKFVLLPEYEKLMADYENNRSSYSTIDSFIPILIKQLQNYTKAEINNRIKTSPCN